MLDMSIASTYPDLVCTPNSTFSRLGVGEPPDGVFCTGIRHHSGTPSQMGIESMYVNAVTVRRDRYGQLQTTPVDLRYESPLVEANASFAVRVNVAPCYAAVQAGNFSRKFCAISTLAQCCCTQHTWSPCVTVTADGRDMMRNMLHCVT